MRPWTLGVEQDGYEPVVPRPGDDSMVTGSRVTRSCTSSGPPAHTPTRTEYYHHTKTGLRSERLHNPLPPAPVRRVTGYEIDRAMSLRDIEQRIATLEQRKQALEVSRTLACPPPCVCTEALSSNLMPS